MVCTALCSSWCAALCEASKQARRETGEMTLPPEMTLPRRARPRAVFDRPVSTLDLLAGVTGRPRPKVEAAPPK